ncbi:MAG TPA: enoyl-CoA hydratase-related protein [Acidimicrobiia bacterium]|jgi:enoyl-CoA hydratase/carnithine racemase
MITQERRDGRLTLIIDDPDKRNPLSNETMGALLAAVRSASNDPSRRVIVITGAGDRTFSAGGDLSGGFVDDPLGLHDARGAFADLFRAMRTCRQPIIARVNGHALAGGFGLAAACDIVVAVDDAEFGMPEVTVGLWPMMITAVVQRVVPRRAALELMLTGRRISASEAKDLGLVSRVVPRAELDDAIDDVVEALTGASAVQLALGKRAFYAVEDMDLDTALDHLQAGLTAVAMTDDAAEGVAAFAEKRLPRWTGR